MPAEKKGKSAVRNAPYDLHKGHHTRPTKHVSPSDLDIEPSITGIVSPSVVLGSLSQFTSNSPRQPSNGFVSRLSEYLKSKNESYKEEMGKMEEALSQAEETKNNLKQTIDALGKTVDALEGAVTAASHILSTSLICSICFETSSLPTSLKCGHSFCRDCLQRWFLSKFEDRCVVEGIKLTQSKYQYIYTPASSSIETERNMVAFATLSNQINPDYNCPTCRDPSMPSIRNCYSDFKLVASLTTLNALIGYVPPDSSEWKLASIDMLGFLNSHLFLRRSERRFSANIIDVDDIDVDDINDIDIDSAV